MPRVKVAAKALGYGGDSQFFSKEDQIQTVTNASHAEPASHEKRPVKHHPRMNFCAVKLKCEVGEWRAVDCDFIDERGSLPGRG
jgi:hypothetical protein